MSLLRLEGLEARRTKEKSRDLKALIPRNLLRQSRAKFGWSLETVGRGEDRFATYSSLLPQEMCVRRSIP